MGLGNRAEAPPINSVIHDRIPALVNKVSNEKKDHSAQASDSLRPGAAARYVGGEE